MLLSIILWTIAIVGVYLVVRFLKKNKAAREIISDGLENEAKILGKKIFKETKEAVADVKEKIDEAKDKKAKK